MVYENRLWSKKRLSSIYEAMKRRCYNSKCPSYENYGGRGIRICEEWLNNKLEFYKFALLNGYTDKLTIDRIDNNKGYSPDNCRFVNMKRQQRNKSNTLVLDLGGYRISVKDFCDITGASYRTVISLVALKKSDAYIINHPKIKPFYQAKKDFLEKSAGLIGIKRS